MHTLVADLKTLFEQNANPGQAIPMAAYMRNQFAYLGIKTPQSIALQKHFFAQHDLPALTDLDQILKDLWALPEREFQYAGVGLLAKVENRLPPEALETIEYLIVNKSWWDTVDSIAAGPLGIHFKRFPAVRDASLARWRASNNLWLRRSAILFQLGYKKETDFPLLCAIIRENLGSKEFFINKAIGWALRQHSRIADQAVRDFVAQTDLHPLSAREALKWLNRHEK
jgi:3-methyladenine DNA glycosylase AlkD